MIKIEEVISYLEGFAPPVYQESYDNAGLLTGDKSNQVTGIVLSLDVTEEVVDECIRLGSNLIIAHHPVIFKGLKRLTGSNYVERTLIKAIKKDIAIYCAHTNLDNVLKEGVNGFIARKLKLNNPAYLSAKKQTLQKLEFYVPLDSTQQVAEAIHSAGGGNIGEYSGCSFRIKGTGYFTPSDQANPTIGSKGEPESVTENKVELIFPAYLKSKIITALKSSHPYEEVAYFISNIENNNQEVGSGIVGSLEKPMATKDFLQFLKEEFNLQVIKHTNLCKSTIKKVAYCGGAGSFLLKNAMQSGADIFITGDFKYHEFFDAENQIIIADIGHFESEIHTKQLFFELLSKKFSNIALNLSKINTNPVNYYH